MALRLILIHTQAWFNQWAFTPPNPSVGKGVSRYYPDQPYLLQIAPLVAKLHQRAVWVNTMFETLFYLFSLWTPGSSGSPVCLGGHPDIRLTFWFCIGWIMVILGACIRLSCFKALGDLFTFDLTVNTKHRLVTDGFYSRVRHPAYTGSLMITLGLVLTTMSRHNWATECGPLMVPLSGPVFGATWFMYTLAVGLNRVVAEDAQLRKMFPEEWAVWANTVHWWFLPGVL
ncbi:Protein-S-isoprenylcysteine O-methyltransferase [Mycena kentingensis (nom. inval.)]|nr:Protein-S-isoprenylcysteine O-methyltransferase [Mycena kentingensis (nom. inval.)]